MRRVRCKLTTTSTVGRSFALLRYEGDQVTQNERRNDREEEPVHIRLTIVSRRLIDDHEGLIFLIPMITGNSPPQEPSQCTPI